MKVFHIASLKSMFYFLQINCSYKSLRRAYSLLKLFESKILFKKFSLVSGTSYFSKSKWDKMIKNYFLWSR